MPYHPSIFSQNKINPRFLVMGENIKNGRRYLILGQNSISSPIFNILPHYEKPGVNQE
jgi:hypothetical protein